jgi:CheY-like chemotaxis protein
MTEEVKKQLFEPFFTTKEEGKGTGLGLAQVYGIVKQHDGHIEVQTAAGKGSTFNVYLPLVESKRERDDGKPKKQHLPGRGETILVVEDADRLRRAIRAGLESLGYEALTAINGHEALKAISRNGIDLVLTDVVMPEMGGEVLLRELRARRPNLKAVAMTGYAAETDNEGLSDGGFSSVIGKPFAIEELASIVRRTLDNSSL